MNVKRVVPRQGGDCKITDAARSFRPKVLYPYHYGETDTARIVALLKESRDIEVRIRRMKKNMSGGKACGRSTINGLCSEGEGNCRITRADRPRGGDRP